MNTGADGGCRSRQHNTLNKKYQPAVTHANQSSLTFDFTHEFDEETDTKIKESFRSFLTLSEPSAQDTANDIARQFRVGQHYPGGYVDQVEDIFICVSKFIPADHIAQDRLIDLVKKIQELAPLTDRPRWQAFLADNGKMSIVEAFYGRSLDLNINEILMSSRRTGIGES